MYTENKDASLETLQQIRSIMDKSARFISLSGWSGVWAGCSALAGAYVASGWMRQPEYANLREAIGEGAYSYTDPLIARFIILGLSVFITAFIGGLYFTSRKARQQQQKLWNSASRQMLVQMFFPLFAGAAFIFVFIHYGMGRLIAPACLIFYGLALISASRHTLSEIRYLGMLDVALGCVSMLYPGYGLYFWATGFGLMHIVYGVIMWNKYDK